jgi:hypothetical protein
MVVTIKLLKPITPLIPLWMLTKPSLPAFVVTVHVISQLFPLMRMASRKSYTVTQLDVISFNMHGFHQGCETVEDIIGNYSFKTLRQVESNVRTDEHMKRQVFLLQHPTCYRRVFYHIIQILVNTQTTLQPPSSART